MRLPVILGILVVVVALIPLGLLLYWNLQLGLWSDRQRLGRARPGRNPLRRYRRPYRDIAVATPEGLTLRGWFVPGEDVAPVFVLCHAFGSCKDASLARIGLLPTLCPVILFDFAGHGDSDGEPCEGMLQREVELEAVLDFARDELGLARFVLWGRCWNNRMVTHVSVRRDDVVGLVLEGAVPTMWDGMRDELERFVGLPAGLFRPGAYLLEKRWGATHRHRDLLELGDEVRDLQVLLLSTTGRLRERRYGARLKSAWSASVPLEVRLPAMHGELIEIAAFSEQTRADVRDATERFLRALLAAEYSRG